MEVRELLLRDTEHLYQKIMEELDLSREIEDEALMELIYTVLSEERREHYMSLQEMNMLGKELFNAFRKAGHPSGFDRG